MDRGKRNGIVLVNALTVAFIVLRLVGAINWAWWAVLAPTWVPLAILLLLEVLLEILVAMGEEV